MEVKQTNVQQVCVCVFSSDGVILKRERERERETCVIFDKINYDERKTHKTGKEEDRRKMLYR